ncbi:MAG: energy-coupled thiamine transporter ThiT [Eubacteriales bacterium]|nr:energy-coupled thiamine transporter ThiT [Eubacteriales bacterium]
MKEWFDNNIRGFVLKDIFGMSTPALIALICFAVLGVCLIATGKNKKNWNARTLAQAALSIAVAFILSCIRLYRMPNGGSVVLCSILPLVAFSAAAGFGRGLVACVAYGFLQIAQGAWIIHPVQGFLDYVAAYAVLSVGAFAPKLPLPEQWKLPAACILAAFGRWLMHVIAGMVFFASDAIDAGQAPFVYSALYNLFLAPEAVLCAVVAATPAFRRVYAAMQRSAS